MNVSKRLTKDSLFNGELHCYQHRDGYRFSLDSVLLAHFCMHWKKATILDIGCGCGIISLILLYRNNQFIQAIAGMEYQEKLAEIARLNSTSNSFDDKLTITHGDLRKIGNFFRSESFSHAVCNPPFYKKGSGRPSQKKEAYLARHQIAATTTDIAACASYSLKNKGTFSLICPAESLMEFLQSLKQRKLQPKRLQCVYSYPEADKASLVLLECIKNGGESMDVLKPLYIYHRKNGAYSKDIANMYAANTI